MSNTVRPEEFGKDNGVLHQMVVTGRKVGAGSDFYNALAEDQRLFARTVEFVARQKEEKPAELPVYTDLECMFYDQAMRLIQLGYHHQSGVTAERYLQQKIWPLRDFLFEPGNQEKIRPRHSDLGELPFLIVVPQACSSIRWQATRIQWNGLYCQYTVEDDAEIVSRPGISKYSRPYLALNVKTNGGLEVAERPDNNRKYLNCLTAEEGLALALQTQVLPEDANLVLHMLGSTRGRLFTPSIGFKYQNGHWRCTFNAMAQTYWTKIDQRADSGRHWRVPTCEMRFTTEFIRE